MNTGWPVLVSLFNKDFIGRITDKPVNERLIGTLATTSISAWLGARVYRVHNIDQTRQTLDMVFAIKGTRPPRSPAEGWPESPACLPGKPLRILDLNAGTVVVVPCDS